MTPKVHKIHSLADDSPWHGDLPPAGSDEHPRAVRSIDRVLAIQRPLVIAHIRSIRLRHPDAGPADIVRILERRYLAAVTAGGAAVGATAIVPGIGTGITLALSGVETVGFLESTALFAQSLAEVHGLTVDSPDRGRALVLTMLLGGEGVDLVRQLAGQASGKGAGRSAYWGEMVTKTLPRAAVGPLVDRLKTAFIHRFAAQGGASWLGKALPFGVGAAVGGAGNNILGRRVVTGSRKAFGPAPYEFARELDPLPGAQRIERTLARGTVRAGSIVAGATGTAARGISAGARAVGQGARRAGDAAGRLLPRRQGDERSDAGGTDPGDAAGADGPADGDGTGSSSPSQATD